jgi:phosphoribosylanthranilate isomerase
MDPAWKPRVKICCIANIEEAWLAIQYGASALGLVSEMPSGPGVIPEDRIAEIATGLPPSITSFLLTSKQNPPAIIEQHRRCKTNAIQLCDRLKTNDYKTLREAMPGIGLVQVIHVTGKEALEEAEAVAPHVNAILLDSGNQTLEVKQLGGTGRTHDWSLSKRIREKVNTPVFLAGGLTPENVEEALRQVQPFGVDVCNGVRTNGKLDEKKLSAFFKAVSAYKPSNEA